MDILALIPSFGGFVWTILAFVVALSVIVAVHEYGHYIVGRWSGIDADVFSLGFGPVLASRMDRRGTRWQIAALPFGGFVKFRGDSDAASGRDEGGLARMSEAERRRTMHGAPVWARAATVAAGPVFNFILSIVIFTGIFLVQGIAIDAPVVGKVKQLPAMEGALLPGDRILSIDGIATPDFESFGKVTEALAPADYATYGLERDGQEISVQGPFPFPPVADGVAPNSAAMEAGIQAGDVIVAVDGTPVSAFMELREKVGNSDGKPLSLEIWRDGNTFPVTLVPKRMDIPTAEGFETRWLIGLTGGLAFIPETRTPGVIEAIGLGAQQTWDAITTSLSGLMHMVTGAISTCNISGPITIAETSGAAASLGISSFIWFIAMLSTAVGLLNLFPVPILDGGHLVFHAFEALTGRPPSDRALRVLMGAGLAAVLSLMIFALTNDIFCP
ncbi:MAG: RIP metalloprotease RseP [Cereibacter sphaeroides]|uniref:Zinc metalloprotease n=1 Tax=Cereibacter sphaeroides TaxID=1063 RepID=A0A2W5SIJ6_CERSP|nr:MAG: RIP metalloprotease RseP [Cereibacter sphaeroides]